MHHTINQYPIQQLNNGQSIEITQHVFEFSSIGPKIYLQANLHGSEVYASFYQPNLDKFVEAKAGFDFILIVKYGIGAIAQGEQIALVGKI